MRKIQLKGKADRLICEVGRLRHQLALIVRGGAGWGDPKSAELSEKIRATIQGWETALTELHALQKETRKCQ